MHLRSPSREMLERAKGAPSTFAELRPDAQVKVQTQGQDMYFGVVRRTPEKALLRIEGRPDDIYRGKVRPDSKRGRMRWNLTQGLKKGQVLSSSAGRLKIIGVQSQRITVVPEVVA